MQWLVSRLHPACSWWTGTRFCKASQSRESVLGPLYRFVCYIRCFRGCLRAQHSQPLWRVAGQGPLAAWSFSNSMPLLFSDRVDLSRVVYSIYACTGQTLSFTQEWDHPLLRVYELMRLHLPISVGEFVSRLLLNVWTNPYLYLKPYVSCFLFSYNFGYPQVTFNNLTNPIFLHWKSGNFHCHSLLHNSYKWTWRHRHGICMVGHDGNALGRRAASASNRSEVV